MNTKLKRYLMIFGHANAMGTVLVFAWTFLVAYSNPSKTVLVSINYYGEATVELIMLLVLLPATIFSIHYSLWRICKKDGEEENNSDN